jgi:hypothetical protein
LSDSGLGDRNVSEPATLPLVDDGDRIDWMEFIPLLLKIVGAIWVIYILASAKALQLGIFDWPEAKAKAVWCLGLSLGVLAFAAHWIIAVCLFLAAFAAYFWTKKALRKPDRSPRQIGILEDSPARVDRMLG